METFPDPADLPDTDELSTGDRTQADIIDIRDYLPKEVAEILPPIAASQNGESSSSDENESRPARFYYRDWKRVEAARKDPTAFEALLKEYGPLIRFKANSYFLIGGEADDLMQEGMIGFYKSVKDYDGTKSSFRNFAELCIVRQIITAVKSATRRKHGPLNDYVSFSHTTPNSDDSYAQPTLEDILEFNGITPEDTIISSENLRGLVAFLSVGLSNLESRILALHMDGLSYASIVEALSNEDLTVKTVDNALQRVKRKIKSYRMGYATTIAIGTAPKEAEAHQPKLEQEQLDWLFEDWLKHIHDSSGSNIISAVSDLRSSPEAHSAVIREVRGYLALVAMDAEWPSPFMAYKKARDAVLVRATELSVNDDLTGNDIVDELIDAASNAIKKSNTSTAP